MMDKAYGGSGKTALRVSLVNPKAIQQSGLSIVDGSQPAEMVKFKLFAGTPRAITLSVPLDVESAKVLRLYLRALLGIILLSFVTLISTLWTLLRSLISFASAEPLEGGYVRINMLLIFAVLAGLYLVRKLRPPFYPEWIANTREFVFRHLDKAGAEDWMRRNEGIIHLI